MDASAEQARRSLRVEVARTGGFAGIRRTWCVERDDDAEDWRRLVDACPWGSSRTDSSSQDRFVWRIEARVDRRRRVATVPDRDLVGPWRDLVNRVQLEGEPPPQRATVGG